MKRYFLPALFALMFTVSSAFAHKALIVHTQEHDIAQARQAVRGGFQDIVESPVTVEQFDYMEVDLVPNGFITMEPLVAEIYFRESVQGLEIEAKVYQQTQGPNGITRTICNTFGAVKGVYMIIEGAGMELDYEVGLRFTHEDDRGGFLNFNHLIQAIDEKLSGGMQAQVSIANYPQAGRVYTRSTNQSMSSLFQVIEDPSLQNYTHYVLFYQRDDGTVTGSDKSQLESWMGDVRKYVLQRNGPDLEDLFFGGSSQNTSNDQFQFVMTVNGNERILEIYENQGLASQKKSEIASAPPAHADFLDMPMPGF